MFTVEIRINGSMVAHIYGHNEGDLPDGYCKYKYESYYPEQGALVKGEVKHRPVNGIKKLIAAILAESDNPKSNEKRPNK